MVMNCSNHYGSCDGTVCGSESVIGDFSCPNCRSCDFSTWAFPHPLILHWVLNPGLMVNELLLGQRIPKITYFCAHCGSEASYVRYFHCSGCNRYHEEAIWTGGNGFGHWLGDICPDCGGEIPCVLNIASWIVLARLSPMNLLLRKLVGSRYRQWEQRRAQQSRRNLEALRKSAGNQEEWFHPLDLRAKA